MPVFFPILETLLKRAFWYRQRLLFRFFFYLLNHSKTFSFQWCLPMWEEEKVSGGSYDVFEQIWMVVERRQHLLNDVHAMLFLLKI